MDKNVLKALTSASIVTFVRKVNYKNDKRNKRQPQFQFDKNKADDEINYFNTAFPLIQKIQFIFVINLLCSHRPVPSFLKLAK